MNIFLNNVFKNKFIPFIIVLVSSIIMVTTIFMPYATATEEQAKKIDEYPDEILYEKLNITSKDMMNISMVKYARIYNSLSEQLWGNSSYGTFYVVLVSLIGGFAVLALIFMLLKKPIAVIIFTIISFAVFLLQNSDYTHRGVIPSTSYAWGMGYYIFYIASIITIIGSVWYLIIKIKTKKQARSKVSD